MCFVPTFNYKCVTGLLVHVHCPVYKSQSQLLRQLSILGRNDAEEFSMVQ